MDRGHGTNQNLPTRFGSYFEFDGPFGSTVWDEEGMLRTGGENGTSFSDLLTGQGVLQGWPASENVMGNACFRGAKASMAAGGTSLRDVGRVEETHTSREPTSQVRPKKACRSRNFSEQEDNLLCSAWVNIGVDPIQGTNQSSSTYWGRITQYFHENMEGLSTDRNQKSLTSRWQSIQENVSKFCGWMQQVENRNQSGKTIADKLDDARSLFESTKNKKFHFLHCYHQLKDNAKWKNLVSSRVSKTGASSGRAARDVDEVYIDLEGQTERPEGTKAAKRMTRTSSLSTWNESVLKETADSMNAHFVQTEARRQELMQLQQEKHEQELAKRHEQLLAARRDKIALLREIEEKKLQHKEKMKAMEIDRNEKMKAMKIDRNEKLKAMEIELKDKHFRMELEGRELNMIMQLDLTKLDDIAKRYYEKRKMKLLAKAEEAD